MARTARVISRMPEAILVGAQVRGIVEAYLQERPELVELCVTAIGSEHDDAGPPETAVEGLRASLSTLFGGVNTGP
eukprot:6375360-Heterocapsa_arctica.AAC.1